MGLVHDIRILIILVIELNLRTGRGTFILQQESTTAEQRLNLFKGKVLGQRPKASDKFLFLVHRCKGNLT